MLFLVYIWGCSVFLFMEEIVVCCRWKLLKIIVCGVDDVFLLFSLVGMKLFKRYGVHYFPHKGPSVPSISKILINRKG